MPKAIDPVEMTAPPTNPKVARVMTSQISSLSTNGLVEVGRILPSRMREAMQRTSILSGTARTMMSAQDMRGHLVTLVASLCVDVGADVGADVDALAARGLAIPRFVVDWAEVSRGDRVGRVYSLMRARPAPKGVSTSNESK